MLQSRLGVGRKLNHRRVNLRFGGVNALLNISLFAWCLLISFSSGAAYPCQLHFTEPGQLEHAQEVVRGLGDDNNDDAT